MKSNEKVFYKHIGQKRQAKESVPAPPPQIKRKEDQVTNTEKAEIFNNFLTLVFTVSLTSQVSQVPEPVGRGGGAKSLSL